MSGKKTIVEFQVFPKEHDSKSNLKCPFGNKSVSFCIYRGGCVQIAGNSGAGKTTIATILAGLSSPTQISKLGIEISKCEWDPSIPKGERCGILFQQTTLLDSLSIGGNVAVALQNCPSRKRKYLGETELHAKIKDILEAVGLDFARDANKRPTELSGGMARRASLALQMAQNKRVIILDEPFTGLDREAATSIAKELVHLRLKHDTALVIISHEPDLTELVMDPIKTKHNETITLSPPKHHLIGSKSGNEIHFKKPSLFGTTLFQRFLNDLEDFIIFSIPLIVFAFLACGLAISMLSADVLNKIDVSETVASILNNEVKPLIKMLTGEEPGSITMMMIKMKVNGLINASMPVAKTKLYAIASAKLFVLEIGPLLTSLLLCGRIGGSYAGKIATMEATFQNKLLTTLGIDSKYWSLMPALFAAIIASPILTIVGAFLAILMGSFVGHSFQICTRDDYWQEIFQTIFPPLRLRLVNEYGLKKKNLFLFTSSLDLRSTFSESYIDSFVEIVTYPPCFLLSKSVVFIVMIMTVAEMCTRRHQNVTPRKVPSIITSSVVISSLFCILVDWGFSRLLLMRKST